MMIESPKNIVAYAITDPSTLRFNQLDIDLERFAKKANIIVYRDKNNPNYIEYAERFLVQAKKYPFEKLLLHGDYLLASSLGADGVHLPSSQSESIKPAKNLKLFVIISCHSFDDIVTAQLKGADMVTLSPVFASPNKGKPLGIESLKTIVAKCKIPVIALGGILTPQHIQYCQNAGVYGFASIRYFANQQSLE